MQRFLLVLKALLMGGVLAVFGLGLALATAPVTFDQSGLSAVEKSSILMMTSD